DTSKYRDEAEVEEWEKRDPLPRFKKYLLDSARLSEDDIESMENEIRDAVDQAWKDATARIEELDGPEIMFDYIYAERPPYLEDQREAFMQSRQDDGS